MKIQAYTSTVPIENGRGHRGNGYISGEAFSTGQDRTPQALANFAGAAQQLNMQVYGAHIKERQELLNASVLSDLQTYEAETAAFNDDYANNFKGQAALDAEEKATAFHTEKLQAIQERYADNPFAQRIIEAKATSIKDGGINALRDYGRQQGEAFKNSTMEADVALGMQKLKDPNTTPFERDHVVRSLITSLDTVYPHDPAARAKFGIMLKEGAKQATRDRVLDKYYGFLDAGEFDKAETMLSKAETGEGIGATPRKVNLPTDIRKMTDAAANKYGIDPDAFAALIHTESSGDINVKNSGRGAIGLGQLLPSTAKDLGVDPNIPEQNLEGAAKYYRQQLDRYNGDSKLALMAYNWGHGNVDSYIKNGHGLKTKKNPTGEVPIETQKYLQKNLSAASGTTSRELADFFTPQEIFTLRQKATAAQEEQAKKQKVLQVSSIYDSILNETKDTSLEERNLKVMSYISKIEDRETRVKILSLWGADKDILDAQKKAQQYSLASDFKRKTDGLNPAQALQKLEIAEGLTDETKEKLTTLYNGKREQQTQEKSAALNDLMIKIDKDEVSTPDAIEQYVLDNALTTKQTNFANKYLENGGQRGEYELRYSTAERAWKSITKKNTFSMEDFEAIVPYLESGKKPTDTEIRRAISRMIMDGESIGQGWLNHDKDETYHEAVKGGRGDTWLPDVTAKEEKEIGAMLRAQGLPYNISSIRAYKRQQYGLPSTKITQQ